MPNIFEILSKFGESFKNLPQNRKITVILILFLLITGAVVLFNWLSKPNYQPLYSNLSSEDAGAIVANLKEEKIPYQLKDGGSTILVPEDNVHELRLQLATNKVLHKGHIGFEIFDQTNLGTTEFVQTINYQRALQGELSRTISSLAEIEWARVHLAIPHKSLFIEEEKPPTASVAIRLRPNTRLNKNQINGIVNLISCSVEGLSLKNIKIIDDQGRILSNNPDDYSNQLSQIAKIEYQSRIEENLEKKITHMLEKALGENKVISKASVVLNLKRVESTEEKFDPDQTVVKSEQRTSESAQGQTAATPGGSDNSNYQKSDENIKYELTKAVNHIVEMPGQITRLSIAVMVDGSYEKVGEETKYIPRTPEEMKSIQTIVEKAAGYDPSRGDQIEVVNIPFHGKSVDQNQPGATNIQNRQFWLSIAKYGAKVILALFILLFVFRPLLKYLYHFTSQPLAQTNSLPMQEEQPAQLQEGEKATIAELQQNLPERVNKLQKAFEVKDNEDSKEVEALVSAIRGIAQKEPKRIAQLTHEWLQEERQTDE